MYCQKCGNKQQDGAQFCAGCGASLNGQSNKNTASNVSTDNLVRFLLTFFLGFIGSFVINITSLRPSGYKSRTKAYFFLGIITLGIYSLVASICNLVFDENKDSNIGYYPTQK